MATDNTDSKNTFHKSGKVIGVLVDGDGFSVVVERDGAKHVKNYTLNDEMLELVQCKIVEQYQKAHNQVQLAKKMGMSWQRSND
jgi:hypothetical protein